MPRSPRLNWPYPSEYQKSWFELFRSFVEALDTSFFTTREDKNFNLFGGGVFTFDATSGVLTWSLPMQAISAATGLRWYMPSQTTGGSVTLQDGEMAFVELTRAPQTPQDIAVLVGSKILPNDDCMVICSRLGAAVVFANGGIIGDGQSIVLFGPRTFTQYVELMGSSGLNSTAETVGYVGCGGFSWDPSLYYPGGAGITRQVKFQAILETTDVAVPAYVQIYNLTAGSPVTNSILTYSGLTPDLLESPILTVGPSGDLPDTAADFEVQIKAGGTPGPTDQITCKMAKLVITWV